MLLDPSGLFSPPQISLTSSRPSRRCPSTDSEHVEKYLSEVEMKLQLMAEDISLALEEQSVAGLRRIPRAVAEIDRVEHDTKSLQSRIQGILRRLDDAEGASRDAVRTLASVDKVKARMEHARETLSNAAGLAELVASVDSVAATGDVRHMADVLSSMRRGLRVVGNVPEFGDAPTRVEVLERRMETLARPELVSALAASDTIRSQEMRDVLDVSGRVSALFSAYADTRVVEPLLREWSGFNTPSGSAAQEKAAAAFAEWVPQYAGSVADAIAREVQWTSKAFPKESNELVVNAWHKLSESTKKEFSQRAATKSLDLFANTYSASAKGFGRAAAALLVAENGIDGASPAVALAALVEALAPFEGVRLRYAELEGKALSDDTGTRAVISALQNANDAARRGDTESYASAATAASFGLAEAAAAATTRCDMLANGLETIAMLQAVDSATTSRIRSTSIELRKLRVTKGMAVPSSPDDQEEAAAPARAANQNASGKDKTTDEANVRAAVSLLACSNITTLRIDGLRVTLVEWLKRKQTELEGLLIESMELTNDSVTPANAAVAADPEKAKQLSQLFHRMKDSQSPFDPIPGTTQKLKQFAAATRNFVLETLCGKALGEFEGYHRRPAWRAADSQNSQELPSFSAYPQEAVTNAGEYLLSLPQTLEQIAEAREEDRVAAAAAAETTGIVSPKDANVHDDAIDLDAGEWMADVARLAGDALLGEIKNVKKLSETGAAQLAADAEYFANVVAALAPEPPAALVAVAACCAAPRDAYAGFAKSDGEAHGEIAKRIAAIRGIEM